MYYTIYKITNKINNKVYIGKHQTKKLDDGYFGSGKHLQRSIAKYGIENFSKEILFVFDNEQEMNYKERELVTEEFCKRKDTYNLCVGGKGGFSYINRHGLGETPQKNAAAKKNFKLGSLAFAKKFANLEFKQIFSEKMSLIVKAQYKAGKPASFLGKHHTEESKEKQRQKMKGRVPWNKGKCHSEETKRKIKEAIINKHRNNAGIAIVTNASGFQPD